MSQIVDLSGRRIVCQIMIASAVNNRAVDGVLAYSLSHDLGLEFHGDYLIEHAYSFLINAPEPLELYFGIGARFATISKGKHENDLALGPRVPVGSIFGNNFKIFLSKAWL